MKYYWKILLVVVFALTLFSGALAMAQETKTYTLLQPLPGMEQTMPVGTILPAYLSVLFKFMLVLAGALAVLMIVFGGIMYITSGGNASSIEKAKSRIWSAIGGLVLAIAAYLILYTINPNLVNLDLGIQPITLTKRNLTPNFGIYCNYEDVINALEPNTGKISYSVPASVCENCKKAIPRTPTGIYRFVNCTAESGLGPVTPTTNGSFPGDLSTPPPYNYYTWIAPRDRILCLNEGESGNETSYWTRPVSECESIARLGLRPANGQCCAKKIKQ
ncbi:MAG: hypothetical protein UU71_C0020G0004 [Parcubacteria group bacterium GW2011_GWB1_41_6]|nr:MAG: hypothetical protein UU71_C0020G0004 [Parcubacteria group bacterium GW2011_GWB1_41_6]KKS33560.1 MAG: hypothetical protein UU96_C0020G0002 [Parcubacteria group bacterium GW2011_GWC2_42_13]KKS71288.1 MAG: hypothetical protein UV43_C0041G0004 [Parcubacteria group bacterium GW2011_GWF2_42_7]